MLWSIVTDISGCMYPNVNYVIIIIAWNMVISPPTISDYEITIFGGEESADQSIKYL